MGKDMGKDKQRKIKSELNKMIVRQEIENRRILKENIQGKTCMTKEQNDKRRSNRRNKIRGYGYNPHGETKRDRWPGGSLLDVFKGDIHFSDECFELDS